MNLTEGEKLILELAAEGYDNFWEAAWQFQKILPQANYDLLRIEAANALNNLLAKGLITIWLRNSDQKSKILLGDIQAEQQIMLDKNWLPDKLTEDDAVAEFIATKLGEEVDLVVRGRER